MPFYLRAQPNRPYWQPALWGAGIVLVLTIGQAAFGVPSRSSGGPAILARIFFVLGFTLLGAGIAGAAYWSLNYPLIKGARSFRWLGMTLWVAISLTVLTLAFKWFDPRSSFGHITRPSFVLSTAVLSVVVGGLFGYGLLFQSEGPRRIYLSPAEFQALAPAERDLLQPASDQSPEPS